MKKMDFLFPLSIHPNSCNISSQLNGTHCHSSSTQKALFQDEMLFNQSKAYWINIRHSNRGNQSFTHNLICRVLWNDLDVHWTLFKMSYPFKLDIKLSIIELFVDCFSAPHEKLLLNRHQNAGTPHLRWLYVEEIFMKFKKDWMSANAYFLKNYQ